MQSLPFLLYGYVPYSFWHGDAAWTRLGDVEWLDICRGDLCPFQTELVVDLVPQLLQHLRQLREPPSGKQRQLLSDMLGAGNICQVSFKCFTYSSRTNYYLPNSRIPLVFTLQSLTIPLKNFMIYDCAYQLSYKPLNIALIRLIDFC